LTASPELENSQGHKGTWRAKFVMSALPPIADIIEIRSHVRFVPEPDIRRHRARAVAYCATNATQIYKKKSW
jgi:hypothetical protein